MKKISKITVLLLIIALTFSCFAGCGKKAESDQQYDRSVDKSAGIIISETEAIEIARPMAVEKYKSPLKIDGEEILDQNGDAYLVSFGIADGDEGAGFCAYYSVSKFDGAARFVTEAQDYYSGMIDITEGKLIKNPKQIEITDEKAIELSRPSAVTKYSSYDGVDNGMILDQNGDAYLVSFGISDEESGFTAVYRVGKLDGTVRFVTEAQEYFSGMIDITAGKVIENPQPVKITEQKAIELSRPSAVTKYRQYKGVDNGEITDKNEDAYLVSFGISDDESGFRAFYRVDRFDGTVRFVTEAQDYYRGMIDITEGKVNE